MHSGAGADVHDVVGAADGFFVVLHDQHRVAQILQMGEGAQQPGVVPLVQADGGFVQDVHHAHQAGADLAGQPYPLRFAAGQGVRAAVQGQVVQAHIHQKLQPRLNLLENFYGDGAAPPGQLQLAEILQGVLDGAAGDLGQGCVADEDIARGLPQAGAAAFGAGAGAQVSLQVLPHHVGFGFLVAALHVGYHAFKAVAPLDQVAAVVAVAEVDAFLAAAVENGLAVLLFELVVGRLHIEAVVPGQGPQHVEVIDVASVPAPYRSLG